MDGEPQEPSSRNQIPRTKFLKASIGVTEYGCNGVKEEQNYVAGTGIVESFHSKNPFQCETLISIPSKSRDPFHA